MSGHVGPAVPTSALPVERVTAVTEQRNPRTVNIDTMATRDILRVINEEDQRVAVAVEAVLDQVAVVVDAAVAALRAGGRVHYFGSGTSGRLGFLDAAELPPTYNAPPDWFQPHQSGGTEALWRTVEAAEDDEVAGAVEARESVHPGDVVLGLSASGRTPYVLGALRAAREIGARTVLVTANPEATAAGEVDVFIGVDTGPEVIAGSTRMKAATAQKLILNAFSTAVMIRLGRVYSNLMVSVVASNAKLRGRMLAILMEATGRDETECRKALQDAGGEVRTALVTLLTGASVAQARQALTDSDDQVRTAVALLTATPQ